MFSTDNVYFLNEWLQKSLSSIKEGSKLLDVGAGELKNKKYCAHLEYVSQDFCQYEGAKGGAIAEGLQSEKWDTGSIDLVSDITQIPAEDNSFDAVLCSEVLEHVPNPVQSLKEMYRLLKPKGTLVLTVPFISFVHMAPYHYCSGFSKFWYEYHLPRMGFEIIELTPNGDWFAFLKQELMRLGSLERKLGNWSWPLGYLYWLIGVVYFKIRAKKRADDFACFGWNCVAVKK